MNANDIHANAADDTQGWRKAPFWVLAFVALWPTPGFAEGLRALGALVAIWYLLHRRFRGGARLLSGQAWALTSVLFAAYWLPLFFSAFDALNMPVAWGKTAADLSYLPYLWLVAAAVASDHVRRVTFNGLAVIAAAWTLDALLQAAFGTSPLFWGLDHAKQLYSGHALCSASEPLVPGRINGVFSDCNPKLGQVLASLSPFALFVAGRRFGTLGWLLAAAAIGSAILLAGARAAWITYALVLLFSGWRLLGWRKLLGVFAFAALLLAAFDAASPGFHERIERTRTAFSGGEANVDVALSGRVQIWRGAWCMIEQHPINGVGARNFRYAWPQCNPEPHERAQWGDGDAHHAHQIVLEILSETGALGLLLWLAGVALAWRAWTFASAAAKERARPAMLALAVTVFPFNTHLAFYSAFWGGLALLLAALYAGSLWSRDE